MNDETFQYRSYSKSELATLYTPFVLPRTAVMKLNEWIERYPGLLEELQQSGLTLRAKRYTPAQVKLIVEALGEP